MTKNRFKIFPSQYLIYLSLSYLAGIFIAELLGYNLKIFLIAWLFLVLNCVIFWRDQKIRLLSLTAICFLFGIFYYHQFDFDESKLKNYLGHEVIVQGQIVEDPSVSGGQSKIAVQGYLFQKTGEKKIEKIKDKILITSKIYPQYNYGEWLEIKGELKEPQKYPDFDYKNYLARSGIHSYFKYPKIQPINQPPVIKQNIFARFVLKSKGILYFIKNKFNEKINQILPEPSSAFLAGLLLGAKKSIPEKLLEAFNRTGTTHIVVISGYNITIIIGAILGLTKRWSKKVSIIFAIAVVILFTIMVGAEAPVLRASLMALLIIWAERIGRKSDAFIALLVAGLLMVLINPRTLRFDIGFQLSFLAVLGLFYLSPIFENLISKNRFKKYLPEFLKEPLVATMAAQIFTAPIILYNFDRLSIIAPLTNLLVLPVIPAAMFFGFLGSIASFIWIGFGKIIGSIAWLILSYIIMVIEYFSHFSFASVDISKISWIWIIGWYFILFVFIKKFNQKKLKEKLEK